MTAVIPTRATGAPIPLPAPAALAAAIAQHRAEARTVAAIIAAAPAPTPALVPHKKRLPSEPAPDELPAVTRDRLRWIDCSAGRHVWAELPAHLGAPVCRHCPVRADQAERVRARAGRP